jgi:hypothetical protein
VNRGDRQPERQAGEESASGFPGGLDPAEVFERAAEHDFVVVAVPNDVHVDWPAERSMPGYRCGRQAACTDRGRARSLVERAEGLGS